MGNKQCSACKQGKPLTDYNRRSNRPSGYASQCKSCKAARRSAENLRKRKEGSAVWRAKNPEKARQATARWRKANPETYKASKKRNRLKAYGLTVAAFAALLVAQEGACAICRTATPTKHGWVVDHDHTTRQVRGVLCAKCNSGIGLLGDTFAAVERAAAYLKAHSK